MAVKLSVAGDIVRRYDPDRFLLTLLAPADCREDLLALYALNHEIAKTRELVTETRLGLIRLQWWRDAIAGIYAGGPVLDHPVVQRLAMTIAQHELPQEDFDNLIYAREFDLEDRLPTMLEGTIKYAELSHAPLLTLAGRILTDQAPVVTSIATAYALTGILRATPLHLSQRRCYLPADRLPMIHRQFDGKDLAALQPVVRDVVAAAKALLVDKSGDKPGGIYVDKPPKHFRGYHKLSLMWLNKIEKADFDLFAPAMQVPPAFKEIRLLFV